MIVIKQRGLFSLPGDSCRVVLWGKSHGNHKSRRSNRNGRAEFQKHLREIERLLQVQQVVVMRPMHWNGLEEAGDNINDLIAQEASFIPFACDGLYTVRQDIALYVASADCPAVIFYSSRELLLLHCGWRSLAHDILKEGISYLKQKGANLSELRIFIAPGIGPCCFEVGKDVIGRLGRILPPKRFCQKRGDKMYIDLISFIHCLLLGEKIPKENISLYPDCTCCHADFWSHRAGDEERNAIVASLTPPT